MRKYIRNMMREASHNNHTKPSRWVKAAWESRMLKRVGSDRRKANQAKGTHPKCLWPSRIALFQSR